MQALLGLAPYFLYSIYTWETNKQMTKQANSQYWNFLKFSEDCVTIP